MVQLYAKIRTNSKYYSSQSNMNESGEQVSFRCSIYPEAWNSDEDINHCDGGVVLNENGNNYRLSDVDLYVKYSIGNDFKITY